MSTSAVMRQQEYSVPTVKPLPIDAVPLGEYETSLALGRVDKRSKSSGREAITAVAEDKRRGAPTSYRQEFDDLVYELRLCAATHEAIARILNINQLTLYNWVEKNPTFASAWELGGEIADSEVARALHSRAKGFSRWITKIQVNQRTGETFKVEEEVYYPPDVRAAMWWLSNRKNDRWKANPDGASDLNGSAVTPPSLHVTFVDPETGETKTEKVE